MSSKVSQLLLVVVAVLVGCAKRSEATTADASGDGPVKADGLSITWHEAAAYCNGPSAKEGRAACYTCSGKAPQVICGEAKAYDGAKVVYTCPGYRLPIRERYLDWTLAEPGPDLPSGCWPSAPP